MELDDVQRLLKVRRLVATGEARSRRLATALSLGEVAGACGVDASTVSRWESGTRRPRGAAALRYAHLLDLLDKETPRVGASA